MKFKILLLSESSIFIKQLTVVAHA